MRNVTRIYSSTFLYQKKKKKDSREEQFFQLLISRNGRETEYTLAYISYFLITFSILLYELIICHKKEALDLNGKSSVFSSYIINFIAWTKPSIRSPLKYPPFHIHHSTKLPLPLQHQNSVRKKRKTFTLAS